MDIELDVYLMFRYFTFELMIVLPKRTYASFDKFVQKFNYKTNVAIFFQVITVDQIKIKQISILCKQNFKN